MIVTVADILLQENPEKMKKNPFWGLDKSDVLIYNINELKQVTRNMF